VSYLLDTNVLSETIRPKPDQRVIEWLDSVQTESLHVSVLSLGEIRTGVEGMEVGPAKRERLRLWLEQALSGWFESRLLPVDAAVADRWGRLEAQTRAEGRPLPAIDSLLAATALQHNLRLVTRNTKDFRVPGLEVLDPWEQE
jgi:predicted nucleic acid-binding protein